LKNLIRKKIPKKKIDKAKQIGIKYFTSNEDIKDEKKLSLISNDAIMLVNEQFNIQDEIVINLLFRMVKDEVKGILNDMFLCYMTDKKPKVRTSRN